MTGATATLRAAARRLPGLHTLLHVVRWVLTIAAFAWIATFFAEHHVDIADAIAGFEAGTVALAMGCVLVGLVPGAFAWQRLLARDLPGVTARRGILVYLRSGIGKYTPGGVLAFAIQHRLLRGERAGMVLLVRVFVGTALAACLAAALVGLPAIAAMVEGVPDAWTAAAALAAFAGLGLACALGRWPILPDTLARIGVPPPVAFTAATAIMALAWTISGTHLAVLGAASDAGAVFLVSAYAFSAIAGIVFAVLPGAFGVRDGVLLAILAARLDPADALALALLSRAMVVAGDVIGTGAAAMLLGRAGPAPEPTSPVPEPKGAFHDA
ncbi:hypothetical protein [Salinarimonas chemoclinalis]|uniref:hypothetical protein n=1 Tax=Salinarimonas chemoclinalis TaxID=3241599 RepID=UPI0035579522